ncbi:MAG: hypothetical protein K8H88_07405 [Sandaracinaceae bacterium]|nr:hypothetical protein [Sandaracinaceae bacterium]
MWIVIGHRVKTEPVPGGARVERVCERCGEHAVFYERRMVRTLQVYFLDVLDYDNRRVMACGACGALYATDEPAGDDQGVVGALEKLGASASAAMSRVGEALVGSTSKRSSARATPEPELEDEDEDQDAYEDDGEDGEHESVATRRRLPEESDPVKAALLRRFAELEKRTKKK